MTMNRRSLLQAGLAATPLAAAQTVAEASGIKIQDVKTYRMPWGMVLVKVTSNQGASGWAECSPMNAYVEEAIVQKVLKPLLIGQDPMNSGPLYDQMVFRPYKLGPGGALANAVAGVDVALWDMKGKLLKVPVSTLLGGAYRTRVPVYFSYGWNHRASIEEVTTLMKKQVDLGFKAVKFRMGWRDPTRVFTDAVDDPLEAYLVAIRKAVGDGIRLMCDLNNGYTTQRAILVGRRLKQAVNLVHYEEPTAQGDYAAMSQVQAAIPDLPVAAGEQEYNIWMYRDLIEQGNPAFVQPDMTKSGITVSRKVAAMCEAHNKQIVCHNTQPAMGTAATLQLVSSIPNAVYPQEWTGPSARLQPLFRNEIRFDHGELIVPDGPGLGLEVNEAAVEATAEK
jgi:L-alanine-DL-glutamate epimerase-like enolase superfamily enzyme